MKYSAFIQSNKKQVLGAKIAKYALETRGGLNARGIPVSIMNVEEIPAFREFEGKPYRRGYAPFSLTGDLQSFTMTRFMPPELMGYEGSALVIDPDIFALSDIGELFELDLGDAGIAACRKNDAWDTSVMVLNTEKLRHWKVADMLKEIADGTKIYEDFAQLRTEKNKVKELSRIWNNLDRLTPETKMLHTTGRLTQPWKTGLPIDFTFNPVPKLFGVIPRFWVRHPKRYQPHPNPAIEQLFFELLQEAVDGSAISREEIMENIQQGDIRADILSIVR